MKNKLINILKIVILSLSIIKSSLAGEVFNFDVTEIEIIENGNIFIGKKEVQLLLKMELLSKL